MLSTSVRRVTYARPAIRALSSWVGDVPLGPPDPILGLNEAFMADANPKKISLGVGAYRDDDGKPYVLPSVLAAESKMTAAGINKEYAGMAGVQSFVDLSLKFAVSHCWAIIPHCFRRKEP